MSVAVRLRSFVVDEANAMALGAANAMLGQLSPSSTSLPPPLVVLHGPSGVGKTHLAYALARSWQATQPDACVVAIAGADFARQWGRANDDGKFDDDEFDENNDETATRPKQRRVVWDAVKLFVLDNVDDLSGKPSAQRVLCDALDAILSAGGRAIVTARRNPTRDVRLMPRLASRLADGLNVPLAKLGRAGRVAVLSELALARGLSLSQLSLESLAGSSPASVAELAGLLVRLDMAARSEGRELDEASIREHVTACGTTGPTLRSIALRTAEYFGVKISELRGPLRRREIVTARSVAMYLARCMTNDSLQTIGRHFSGRDHATVSHSVDKVAELLADSDIATCQAVGRIRERVLEG
ncbi:MAG: helix-turn-helix domain-containing protein [Pirellulales bacterium]